MAKNSGHSSPPDKSDEEQILILPSDLVSFADAGRKIFTEFSARKILYSRSGKIMELKETGHGPELSLLVPAALQSRIDRLGFRIMMHVEKRGEYVLRPKRCSCQTAAVLLESREAQEILPPIGLITSAPVLIEHKGNPLVLGPGYHREGGGILVTGGETPHAVRLDDAVRDLRSLLRDFDFPTPSDESRAMAMLITPALKMGGLLQKLTPIDIAEADQSQSGKTYRQAVTREVYRERGYAVTRRTGGVGSLDESLAAAILSGRAFIAMDNLRGKLDSQYLEAVVTWPNAVPVRVPYKGEVTVDARRVTFAITSNGIEMTRDLANRSCLVRIRKQPEGYQWHPWPEGSLIDHVTANQPHYLGCIHAIVRHWMEKGCPSTGDTRHDMREWAGALDRIVQEIFGSAPLLDGHDSVKARSSTPALGWLRAICLAVDQAGLLAEGLTASDILNLMQEQGIPWPGSNDQTDETAARQYIGRLMGNCFRGADGDRLTLDGYQILRTETQEHDEEHRCNRPVKRYTITKDARCP